MARSNLGAGVRSFRTRAPSNINLTPSKATTSGLGKPGTAGPSSSAGHAGTHGVRVQGTDRVTKTKAPKGS